MSDVFVPRPVSGLRGVSVSVVACGDTHTLVVSADGRLYCFGRNQNGQLGLGTTADALAPERVEALGGAVVTGAACGSEHSLVCTGK